MAVTKGWTFRWIDRPATRILQFEREGDVRGSLSIDKDNKEDIEFFQRIIDYAIDIQDDNLETHTRIN